MLQKRKRNCLGDLTDFREVYSEILAQNGTMREFCAITGMKTGEVKSNLRKLEKQNVKLDSLSASIARLDIEALRQVAMG